MSIHEAPIGGRSKAYVRRVLIELAFVLLLVVLLAAMGPFGTYQSGPWPSRLAYWTRTLLVGYVLFRPGLEATGKAARSLGFPVHGGWISAVLALSVPMSVWLWFFGPSVDLDRPWPTAAQFMETYAQVVFVAGLAAAGLWWLAQSENESQATKADRQDPPEIRSAALPSASDVPPIGERLAGRLPAHLGLDIIALEMEDHYVRVHTVQGSALVLMRMGDAAAELAAVDGMRVHRSWWAARSAIDEIVRQGRTTVLVMKGGLQVPVARDRMPDLLARGWL